MEGRILIVDDEEGIRNPLGEHFREQGFSVTLAEDGAKALSKIKLNKPDIIILDVILPLIDGLDICRKVRQEYGHTIGIVMISEIRKEMVDRIVGLELGADIYVPKPFKHEELGAQVRALLRRMQAQQQSGQDKWFVVDDYLRIDFERRIVEAGKKEVDLTKLEFDLLRYLIDRQGKPVGRLELKEKVWGYEGGSGVTDFAVNSEINKLRSDIERDPKSPQYILSVHGIGYKFGR
jgi:DNA-binding response OmpR family regulator